MPAREWVIISESIRSRIDREQAIAQLHLILTVTENLPCLCRVIEVVDLNRYKVFRKEGQVKKAILRKDKKTFEFFFFKN
jgi:hypothetical protein